MLSYVVSIIVIKIVKTSAKYQLIVEVHKIQMEHNNSWWIWSCFYQVLKWDKNQMSEVYISLRDYVKALNKMALTDTFPLLVKYRKQVLKLCSFKTSYEKEGSIQKEFKTISERLFIFESNNSELHTKDNFSRYSFFQTLPT